MKKILLTDHLSLTPLWMRQCFTEELQTLRRRRARKGTSSERQAASTAIDGDNASTQIEPTKTRERLEQCRVAVVNTLHVNAFMLP
jgi:hypothetical protein